MGSGPEATKEMTAMEVLEGIRRYGPAYFMGGPAGEYLRSVVDVIDEADKKLFALKSYDGIRLRGEGGM